VLHYPIQLRFNTASERKWPGYNAAARALEAHINNKIAAAPADSFCQFMYHQLARELGLGFSLVEGVLFAADCGSHGITIVKGNMDRALERSKQSY
jgi:hypothetical protein